MHWEAWSAVHEDSVVKEDLGCSSLDGYG